jgi:hypothetical protein
VSESTKVPQLTLSGFDPVLKREFKTYVAKNDTTMVRVTENLVRDYLADDAKPSRRKQAASA